MLSHQSLNKYHIYNRLKKSYAWVSKEEFAKALEKEGELKIYDCWDGKIWEFYPA